MPEPSSNRRPTRAIGDHGVIGNPDPAALYRGDDGLQGGEGAFTTCTFWNVECLARAGRFDEAQMMMENARPVQPCGTFSEELSLIGEPLGKISAAADASCPD